MPLRPVLAVPAHLVTPDNALLDLKDEAKEVGRDFRARHPGLLVPDPVTFLRRLSTPGDGSHRAAFRGV